MIRLGVIFGGRSGEHEISLMSATSVIKAIDKNKFLPVFIGITREGKWLLYDGPVEHIEDGGWQKLAEEALATDPEKYGITVLGAQKSLKDWIDFALPVLHGPYGEDGTIQGLFEMADIPYGGCGVLGSAAAMDKSLAKEVFAKKELPICRHLSLYKEELDENFDRVIGRVEKYLPYPIFVKPANMGSSVGISKAKNREELTAALELAMKYDRRLILEEGLDCREIETGVLGNYRPEAAAVGEILPSAEFYSYEAKYFDGGMSKICIPADLPDEVTKEVREIAVEAYRLLDCCGFARVDFFLERGTNKVYINEINTIPGFTKYSMFPLLWAEKGLPYPELIEKIIQLGFERYEDRKQYHTV
ncbi:D-alanine--D-alanine ligase [Anoxybacterium hadale]|uniref:D-alanine--D-alanine ligase n=1 Tax=Anoxybacterium hadale TaxID=3408580 RepID=A0ACD1AET4_9FIRM|nr:D-alanine--D-alanine ligase [Clostridiales bacterium]